MKYLIALLIMILGSAVDSYFGFSKGSYFLGYSVGILCTVVVWWDDIVGKCKKEIESTKDELGLYGELTLKEFGLSFMDLIEVSKRNIDLITEPKEKELAIENMNEWEEKIRCKLQK